MTTSPKEASLDRKVEDCERGRCSRGQALLAMSFMLTCLYVLSAGPVINFSEQANIARRPVRIVYSPLIWVHKHTPLLKPLELYSRYFGLEKK